MWSERVERAEKAEVVTELTSSFKDAGSIVVARNTGLTVADLENLRRQMKEAGGSVKVAKNRLAKLALKETETADISALFTGPTILAFAQDPVTAPKVAAAFADNGRGVRGDLGAVLRAVLLDPEARDLSRTTGPHWGKQREPVIRFANFLRAFNDDGELVPGGTVEIEIASLESLRI